MPLPRQCPNRCTVVQKILVLEMFVLYSRNLLRVKTFANFVVSGQFAKVLTEKIFIECGAQLLMGVSLIFTTATAEGLWIDVASLSLARQYLSNNSLLQCLVYTL